jgi:predicted transposase/invertase (TIGR01784 family)
MVFLRTYIDETEEYFYHRGEASGRSKTREEGRTEGLEEGRLVGMEENQREIAIKMKEHGLLPELIAEITDMSIEEIEMM